MTTLSLSSLTPSCVALIGEYLLATNVYNLWLTGDKTLQRLMGPFGGIRSFKCQLTSRLHWPPIVAQLHRLLHFSLSVPSPVNTMRILNADLACLPPTLRSLELQFANAFGCVHRLTVPSLSPSLQDLLPNLTELVVGGAVGPVNFDKKSFINSLPRGLISLNLSTKIVFPIDLLRLLPCSLVKLSIDVSGSRENVEFLDSLPRPPRETELSFSTLETSINIASSAERPLFPPHLEELCLYSDVASPRIHSHLPNTLRSYEIRYTERVDSTEVTYGHLHWDQLPRGLKILTYAVWCSCPITPTDTEQLPRGLTEFNMPYLDEGLTLEAIKALPSGLQIYNCPLGGATIHGDMLLKALTAFPLTAWPYDFSSLMLQGSKHLPLIPRTVTDMFAFGIPWRNSANSTSTNALSSDMVALLPPNLASVTCDLVDEHATSKLPKTLTWLDTQADLPAAAAETTLAPIRSRFPRLKRLHLTVPNLQILDRVAPPDGQLLDLSLRFIKRNTGDNRPDERMSNIELDKKDWAKALSDLYLANCPLFTTSWVQSLPRSLTSINFQLEWDADRKNALDPEILLFMPPNLTRLSVYALTLLKDEHLRPLPKRLTSLSLFVTTQGSKDCHVTEAGIKSLSPVLVELALMEIPIDFELTPGAQSLQSWLPPRVCWILFMEDNPKLDLEKRRALAPYVEEIRQFLALRSSDLSEQSFPISGSQ